MKYVWAAYKRGVFDQNPEIPSDLDPFEFKSVFLGILGTYILGSGGEAWILEDKIPIGMVLGSLGGRNHLEPHVFWFPEATPRNKIEFSVRWIVDVKKKYKLDIWVHEANWKFYHHLCKYGIVRPVGKRRKFFNDDTDAMYFQEVN